MNTCILRIHNGIHKGRGYRAVLSSRTLVVGLIAYFVFQTGNFAAMSFFGSWFSRDFGLSTAGIGVAMIAIGAGNAAGPLFAATPQFVGVAALTVAAFLVSLVLFRR